MAEEQTRNAGGGRFLGSVEKAFAVLNAFNVGRKALSLGDVSRISAVDKNATQRVLFTLKSLGYLRQDPQTRLYSLSARMLDFGTSFLAANKIREVAEPILEQVNETCEETVNLTEREGTEVVYVLRYPSRHVVSVDLSVGSRLPIYCTAPGRAILAHLPEQDVGQILSDSRLEARTSTTETDPQAIIASLPDIRAKGYCLTNQEAFVGDISVSAPVFDERNVIAGAINIAVPWPRWQLDRVEAELAPIVVDAARSISLAMKRQ
ncbi:MAG TPA: IclR family transcriptional regulator [Devosiaceae bacterium]|jgi:DNA-binding IclR family transcriptional regulator|nr:IclR family transcriptional regulator [Devosiaceae bacterium]